MKPVVTLGPGDLGLPDGVCADTGFAILQEGSAGGPFPAALAVARLQRSEGGTGAQGLRPTTLKEERAVWWNSLFDAVPAIREVIVLSERTPEAGPGVGDVAAAAGRLNASLCLVYGPSAAGPDEAALTGALLDTRNRQVVACIQARATPADFEPRRKDRPRGDRRHVDPEYLAARKFEQQVRACVVELVARDSASAVPPGDR